VNIGVNGEGGEERGERRRKVKEWGGEEERG